MEVKNNTDVKVDGLVSNKEVNKHGGTEMPDYLRNTIAQIMETYHSKLLHTTSITGAVLTFFGLMTIVGSLLVLSDHKAIAIALIIVGFILMIIGFLTRNANANADSIRKGDFIYFESIVNQVKTPTPSTKIFYTVEDIKTVPLLDSDSDSLRDGSEIICIYTGKGILCTDKEYHNIKEYEKVNGRSKIVHTVNPNATAEEILASAGNDTEDIQ